MLETEYKTTEIAEETHIVDLPSVSIAIPAFNEEKHIRRVVESFLSTNYPNLVEILIADGQSTDRTREIVAELTEQDKRVKLVDNPEKYQSFGLNHMINIAEGEIFLRADGHCHYMEDYVERCVSVMLKTGARNVGGAQRYMAKNRIQAGIAFAVKSLLGNGGAKYMDIQYSGYADTVFLGCFNTTDLREIGGFNTENVTNQDSELNLRLIEKHGPTVYISSEIKSWYYPRDTFFKLFKQYFRYGRGRFLTRTLHPKSSPIRGMIPFLSLFILTLYTLTDAIFSINLFSIEILGVLALIVFIESFRVVLAKRLIFKNEIWNKEDGRPGTISNVLTTVISLVLMQFGHFFGFLFQMVKSGFNFKKGW